MKPKFDAFTMVVGMSLAMICAVVFTALGSTVFVLPTITAPDWVEGYWVSLALDSVLLWANVVCVAMLTSRNVLWRVLAAAYPFIVGINYIGSMPVMLAFALALCFVLRGKMPVKEMLIRYMLVSIVGMAYQQIALFARTTAWSLGYVHFSVAAGAVMNLDTILFLVGLIILDRREAANNGLASIALVFRGRKFHPARVAQIDSPLNGLSGFDKAGLIVMQLIQLVLVSLVVSINGKLLVFLVLYLFGFFPMGGKMSVKYHADSYLACCWQSAVFFFMICSAIPALNISIMTPVIAGGIGCFAASMYAYRVNRPTLKTMTGQQIKSLIEKVGLSEIPIDDDHPSDAEFARLRWVDKLTIERIQEAVNFSNSWCRKKQDELKGRLESAI